MMIDKRLSICPECGSGDTHFCFISVRPYCDECNHWAPVNYGTEEESIEQWNARSLKNHGFFGQVIPRDWLNLTPNE